MKAVTCRLGISFSTAFLPHLSISDKCVATDQVCYLKVFYFISLFLFFWIYLAKMRSKVIFNLTDLWLNLALARKSLSSMKFYWMSIFVFYMFFNILILLGLFDVLVLNSRTIYFSLKCLPLSYLCLLSCIFILWHLHLTLCLVSLLCVFFPLCFTIMFSLFSLCRCKGCILMLQHWARLAYGMRRCVLLMKKAFEHFGKGI